MADSDRRSERRRHARVSPKGTIVFDAGDHALRGRIANLGPGGLYAITRVTAPEQLLEQTIELKIRLDGQDAGWLTTPGRVTRITADGIAIAFVEAPALLVRAIEAIASESQLSVRVLSVVLIDADAGRLAAMTEGFGAVGCIVVAAATPLEAIVRLGESAFEPDLIAIADSAPENVANNMRRFVELNHPTAKLVTIGDELIEPAGIANWLSSANPGLDLPKRVREILVRPRRQ
jgi:hypothetical protein